MEKVTGIGGIFLKAKNVKELTVWYQKHLGIDFGDNSYVDFKWENKNNPAVPGHTIFSFFKEDTTYFQPSDKPVMINFRVKDLHALLTQLEQDGVQIVGEVEEFEYGKFGWIVDPEGNKIELWEPTE
jgi:predicted enzyme related to lactoylglutathione lyase